MCIYIYIHMPMIFSHYNAILKPCLMINMTILYRHIVSYYIFIDLAFSSMRPTIVQHVLSFSSILSIILQHFSAVYQLFAQHFPRFPASSQHFPGVLPHFPRAESPMFSTGTFDAPIAAFFEELETWQRQATELLDPAKVQQELRLTRDKLKDIRQFTLW